MKKEKVNKHGKHHIKTRPKEYIKFFGVIGCILLLSLFIGYKSNNLDSMNVMRIFIGLFFLTLGILKFLNINEFVSAYTKYDILAKNNHVYAYVYPFIELQLGALYLINYHGSFLHVFTAGLMIFSAYGVLKVLLNQKHSIILVRMGSFIKVPVTKITLIENVLMGVMALVFLFG